MSETNIKSYSLDELRAKQKVGESLTNLAFIDSRTEADIERLANEDDAELGVDGWELDSIELVTPKKKRPVSVRLDEDIIEFFTQQGPGYQTRINAVLRHFVNQKKRKVQS